MKIKPSETEEYIKVNGKIVRKTGVSNCGGTGLYLSGEIEEDIWMSQYNTFQVLRRLKKSKIPKKGFIISLEGGIGNEIRHIGIVSNEHPLKITSRWNECGAIKEDTPFKEVYEEYHTKGLEALYFIPRNLL